MSTAKKKRKKWPWILAAIIIVVVVVVMILSSAMSNRASTTVYTSYTVSQKDVVSTITGSGSLAFEDSISIEIPSEVKVNEVYAKVGDAISEGDVLATLDTDSLSYRASELSEELSSLDRNIASVATTSNITSPAKGRIKYLPVSEGNEVLDAINAYGCLALISTDGFMQVEITTEAALELHSDVTVEWENGSEDGEIAFKTANGYLIQLDDADAPYKEKAQVYDKNSLLGEGTLEIQSPVSVLGTGGTIDDIRYDVGDNVSAGTGLFTLTNKPATNSYKQAFSERADKAEELQTVLALIADPQIIAPASGIVNAVYVSDGEKADSTETQAASSDAGTEGVTAFELSVGGAVKMDINVDEIDINIVELGQEVEITLDAYAGEVFPATVTHISKIGSVSGSITTYAVEITLDYDVRLLEGMNGSAVITADRAENVPVIPIAAINEDQAGPYVYVQSSDGQRRVDIKTGLSDGTNAEVTDGLAVGDVILYVDTASNASALMGNPFGGGMAGGAGRNSSAVPGGGE